jgi:hypothetical protein
MRLEIVASTDGKHIGVVIPDANARPIRLAPDRTFYPERVLQVSPGVWRLANPSYVVDAKE